MKKQYLCPVCKAYLRVHNNIIFSVNVNKKNSGILLLNPTLGNYSNISHPTLCFESGESVEFFCPVCHVNLTAEGINSRMVKILMIDAAGHEFDIFFSKIVGEQSTFKIKKDDVLEKFGKDSTSYVNYFESRLKQNLAK